MPVIGYNGSVVTSSTSAWYRQPWPYGRRPANSYDKSQTVFPSRMECGHMCTSGSGARDRNNRQASGYRAWIYQGRLTNDTDSAVNHRHFTCCRCAATRDWFKQSIPHGRVQQRDSNGDQILGPHLDPKYVSSGNCYPQNHWLRFGRRSWARFAPVHPFHIGWHAGLKRPVFPVQSYNGAKRIKVCDRYGVSSAPYTPKLCHCCASILHTIEPVQFWLARGFAPDIAERLDAQERHQWKGIPKKDQRVDRTILDGAAFNYPWPRPAGWQTKLELKPGIVTVPEDMLTMDKATLDALRADHGPQQIEERTVYQGETKLGGYA